MREVEVKAKLKNKAHVLEKLSMLGCTLSSPVVQKDTIYIPEGTTIPVEPYVSVLRVREQGEKYIFTLKQAVTNQLDCIERELEISDPEAMDDIVKYLHFFEVARVEKSRQKCTYRGYEICVDEVTNLGSFIEVEKMVENPEAPEVQAELLGFLLELGVAPEDQVFDGYDVLLRKKMTAGI